MNTQPASRWRWASLALLVFISVICLALLAVSSVSAQTSTTGNIEGTVVDTTGAPIPGVTVSASRAGGGGASATTNDDGLFRLTNLQPGRYTVMIEAGKGFAKFVQANVEVNLSRSTNLGIQLRPVGVAETVEVTASTPATVDSPTPTTTENPGKVTTNGGLTIVTFDTKFGNVRVNLPDDMRAGDTISGTAVAEPKGQTEEERAKNLAELNSCALWIKDPSAPGEGNLGSDIKLFNSFTFISPFRVTKTLQCIDSRPASGVIYGVSKLNLLYTINVEVPPAGTQEKQPTVENGAVKDTMRLPTVGQQGRPVEIFGPFDGNASNTTLRFGPPGSTIREFVKASDSVEGGFGVIKPLAESPRKLVFEVPASLIGPIELNVKDGNNQATGTHRNVGVRLSAPKTSLLKGEKTTLTTEVSGLQGITKAVPLTLTSEGVITMEGGPYQQLMIKPSEVNASGKYTTTRQVTGIMAGGWGATATVVTGRFNVWLQDDSDPNRIFHFNSFTGEYIFACGGGSCRSGGSTGGTQTGGTPGKPGGTTQPGGTDQPGGTLPGGTGPPPPIDPSPPVTLTGTGKPAMKGCIITLSHNAPDRRVFARLDACTKTGDASVETKSPKANLNITDKNTTDNTTASPPPK